MQKAIVVFLLAVAAFAGHSLVSGAAYLEAPLPGGLPLGNALTALGLCSAALVARALSARGTVLRIVAATAVIAAMAWLPLSIALAGNLLLDFSGDRGVAWMGLSLATVAVVVGALLWALIRWLLLVRARRT